MKRQLNTANARSLAITLMLTAAATALGGIAGHALSQNLVSQKGRAFSPNHVVIRRGEVVRIANDDADLRHHLYISADDFTFDSGDQKPGTVVSITFPKAGEFEVLCAIHPKMRMVVKVK